MYLTLLLPHLIMKLHLRSVSDHSGLQLWVVSASHTTMCDINHHPCNCYSLLLALPRGLTAIFQANTRTSPFWILLELRMMEVVSGDNWRAKLQLHCHHQQATPNILQAGCPSCHPTNSVKALKGNEH